MQKLSRRRVAQYAAEQLAKHESPMKLANYLAAYLAETKQIKQADMLLHDIESVLASRYGLIMADVTTARPLPESLRTAVTALVKQTHKADRVVLSELVNPDLIGGVTVTTPSGYFDGSVRKKLQNLQVMKNKEI